MRGFYGVCVLAEVWWLPEKAFRAMTRYVQICARGRFCVGTERRHWQRRFLLALHVSDSPGAPSLQHVAMRASESSEPAE